MGQANCVTGHIVSISSRQNYAYKCHMAYFTVSSKYIHGDVSVGGPGESTVTVLVGVTVWVTVRWVRVVRCWLRSEIHVINFLFLFSDYSTLCC